MPKNYPTCFGTPLAALSAVTISVLLGSSSVYAQSRTVPTQGSGTSPTDNAQWTTAAKWNLFAWRGKSDAEIRATIGRAYGNFLTGDGHSNPRSWNPATVETDFPLLPKGQGNDARRIVYPYLSDEAYVFNKEDGYDPNNPGNTHGVLSEGQSWAMMIAVQLNDKRMFDKLWRFAKNRMQHNGQAPNFYYFRWHLDFDPSSGALIVPTGGQNPAPDGDEWFAAALLAASGRWGNGSGIYDYKAEANKILRGMLHLETPSYNNGIGSNYIRAMFTNESFPEPKRNQVWFVPFDGNDHTDPSYHLPAFYEYFARCGPAEDKARWERIASKSRRYLLPRATGIVTSSNPDLVSPANAVNTEFDNRNTGIPPDYSTWAGAAIYRDKFLSDGWRVISNVAVDYMWWKNGTNQWEYEQQMSNRLLNFFASENATYGQYDSSYRLNGTQVLNPDTGQPYGARSHAYNVGLIGMNGAGALISNSSNAASFVDELWNPVPDTDWSNNAVYYNGTLYLLGLLQASGNFRPYGTPSTTTGGGTNLLVNGGFESNAAQSPTGWLETETVSAGYSENSTSAHGGSRQLAHWSGSAYKVYTYQSVNVPNGNYTVRAWYRGGGSLNGSGMTIKNYNGGSSIWKDFKGTISGTYQKSEQTNIAVTSGKIEVGFWTDANANGYVLIDDVEVIKQ